MQVSAKTIQNSLLMLFVFFSPLLSPPSSAANDPGEAATLVAPYFFIEGDDSGVDRLPLKAARLKVDLNGFIAGVELTQIFRNDGNQAIHATYIFPGSTRAAVHGMTMTIGARKLVAKIEEKQQARATFEAAKSNGKSAAMLAQKRPNVFSMEVANILPGDEVQVVLRYSEWLTAEDGRYEFVYPGVVGPRYGGDAAVAPDNARWIQNPYLAESTHDPVAYSISVAMSAPLPISSLTSPSHAITTNWQDQQSIQVSLADPTDAGNRDFILQFRLQDEQIMTGLTQFEQAGEHYFLLVAEPPTRIAPNDIPAREYFFVVDVSGSMSGFPLATTKALMLKLLQSLRITDRFNLLFFAGSAATLAPQALPASPANIARAQAMLEQQRGGGGTELYAALQQVLSMRSDENVSRNIVLVTDGYISAEQRVFKLIDEHLHRNNLFAFGVGSSVNRFLIEGVAKAGRAEAFVVTSKAAAEQQVQRFHAYISAPVLTNIEVTGQGVQLYDLEPSRVPDLLAQRPIMIAGKFKAAAADASIQLSGMNGAGEQHWDFPLQDASAVDATLPQLWARKRLERLYVLPKHNTDEQRAAILALGLQYHLLTQYTSFVAVDETRRADSAGAHEVVQPLPLPSGVSNRALGQPMPEPEIVAVALLMMALFGLMHWRRKLHALHR